jgi:hypothetical protein
MSVLFLFLVVTAVLLLCVTGMAVGVMAGRKPIQHCGNATVDENGNKVECALCGNTECKNK